MSAGSGPPSDRADEDLLHRLGYAQVLYREVGGFSNFAISFTIVSVLAGCLTSYSVAFTHGGPVAVTWGWLLVGAFSVLVAMAMGEIASSMPTAGALYFWSSRLGGPAWGWFTGWFSLVGQISVTAAIDYGAATFTTALLHLWFPVVVGDSAPTIFVVFTAFVALNVAVNLLDVNLLAQLNTISAWWHMIGVGVVVTVLALVPRHQPVAFVFTQTIDNSGFTGAGSGFTFALGLIMSAYTITGYDASAHMSEETRRASRAAAVGMVMAVVASVVFGFVLLVAVTFAVPDVPGTLAAAANAVVYVWTTSMGSTWAEFLLVIAVVAQFFCGTASVISASRMMFAFSRDRAVPGSRSWRKLARNRVPANAVVAIGVLAWLLMVPSLVSHVAYLVATSTAVVGLNTASALPIILRVRAGSRFPCGAWSLGRHYRWISPLAVAWTAVICVIGVLPVSPRGVPGADGFTWALVNFSPLALAAALLLFGGWYLVSARAWFTGPIRQADSDAELAAIERELRL